MFHLTLVLPSSNIIHHHLQTPSGLMLTHWRVWSLEDPLQSSPGHTRQGGGREGLWWISWSFWVVLGTLLKTVILLMWKPPSLHFFNIWYIFSWNIISKLTKMKSHQHQPKNSETQIPSYENQPRNSSHKKSRFWVFKGFKNIIIIFALQCSAQGWAFRW